ncbi:hypothetical protein TNCT_685191 [Trichonephila clavata]|uniref:Uncharacterized protein n=1 Tax=Trichonephila clavata TaxID=2740835 RepID=A0A8X6FVZ7_TRICU|nr:hypothetical protein TNCT_685191 [Trichonephila clavata]
MVQYNEGVAYFGSQPGTTGLSAKPAVPERMDKLVRVQDEDSVYKLGAMLRSWVNVDFVAVAFRRVTTLSECVDPLLLPAS